MQKDKVKKAVLMLMFILLIIVLAGCTKVIIDPNGIERNVSYGFVEVETIMKDISCQTVVCYDPKTMVCYLKMFSTYQMGLSPYYVIGEDGKPEIAVYGVNYN